MTNVFRLTLVALFISACNDVAAQACPSDQDLAALIAKAPPCRLIKPQGGAEGTPFYVTSMDPKNTQCQIPNDAFGANLLDQPVTIDYTLDKVPAKLPAANSECISTFQKDGKTTLFVELPSVSSKKNLWIIKKKDGSAIVNVGLLSPSVSKGIAPAKDAQVRLTYPIKTGETTFTLDSYLTIAYGQPSIFKIEPKSTLLTSDGLTLILNRGNETNVPKFTITVRNEYGEMILLNVEFLPGNTVADSTTTQSLKIELANVRKLIADERYIRTSTAPDGLVTLKDKDEISKLYDVARNTVPLCTEGKACAELSNAQVATAKLLKADIDYRKILLDKRLTFWGGFRTLKPTTPHREMIKLLDLLAKFQSANERMEKWQFRGQNKAEKSQELSAEKAYVMGQINAEELSGQAKDIDTNRWKRIRVTNDATMKQVQLEMNRVSQRMAAVSKQQAALTSQATSLTIGIAASVTGLPVDVVTNAAKGDLKAAVIGYATAELSNPNSPLSSELNSLGSTLVESNKTISQLYTKYKDAAELKNDLEFAAASIREPSLERFLKVGEIAYSKLDAGQVQALDQLIEQQKPVQAWIQAAYQKAVAVNGQAEQFRKSLQNIINFIDTSSQEFNSKIGNFNDQVTGLLLQEFRKAKLQGDDAIRNMETQLLQNLKGLAIEQNNQLSILINALTIYPNYLAQANPPLWADLKAVYPNATNEWLAQQVISAGMVALNNLEKDKQKIVPSMVIVFDEAGKFKINSQKNSTYNIGSEILQKSINIDLKTLRTNVDEQVNALMSTVAQKANSQRQTQALLSYAATVASPEAAASFVAKLIPVGDASKINAMWDSIKTVNGELTKQAQMGVRYAAAASIAAPAIPQSAPAPAPAPVDVSIPGADPEQAKQSAMLSMALNAAFPGAGVALQLVQNFAAMDANRQLSEQLNQQSVQLMAAMNELMKASGDIDSNEAISQKEYARAIALADAAKAQLGQYNATIDTVLSSTQDVDVRIRLYRPYYFYLAELLRQQFDLFDRSLAMWSGASDSRGFFATQIASDPAQARLALDSEIHLFDWLNRDREATKTDPFVLFVHWQQLVALAQGYCADHGCKPGDNQLGQIGITARRSIFDDLGTPELRGQFEQWKKGPMNGPFKFSITLDPSKRLLPDRFVNVRNLDWNVVPTTRKGTVAGNFLQVRHLGHAQIPYQKDQLGIRFRDESMLPTTFSPSNRSAAFDLTALSDRFQSQTGITSLQTLRALEGYGVYGQYEITVLNTPPARDFDDFMVEIAYIYTDPSNITSERMFMNSISEPAKGACKEPNGRNPDVPNCREIFYFATDGCVGPPPTDPLLWLDSSPGLEFLFATKPDKNARVRTLCYAKVPIPVVQQAMNLQRVSRNCTWTNAIAYIKNGTKSACSGGVK